MSSAVTVLVPLAGASVELPSTLETVEEFLQNTGFAFTIRVLDLRDADASARPAYGRLAALRSVVAIRLTDRRNGYRAARRCPICFSSEVWTWAQIPGNLVRACGRCKCRYLNRFSEEREGLPVRRELLPNPAPSDPFDDTAHGKVLIKPGGVLLLTAFDTEGLL